jgi:hypothetical protein
MRPDRDILISGSNQANGQLSFQRKKYGMLTM